MDNTKFKKDLWWMLPLLLVAAICLVLGFDPVGQLIGQQNAKWAINAILVVAFLLTFVFSKPKK